MDSPVKKRLKLKLIKRAAGAEQNFTCSLNWNQCLSTNPLWIKSSVRLYYRAYDMPCRPFLEICFARKSIKSMPCFVRHIGGGWPPRFTTSLKLQLMATNVWFRGSSRTLTASAHLFQNLKLMIGIHCETTIIIYMLDHLSKMNNTSTHSSQEILNRTFLNNFIQIVFSQNYSLDIILLTFLCRLTF